MSACIEAIHPGSCVGYYPLVMTNMTETYNFKWLYQLFQWPLSIYKYIPYKVPRQNFNIPFEWSRDL